MNHTALPNVPSLNLQNSQLASSRDTNIHFTTQVLGKDPFEILEQNIVLDALFDSDARYDPPKCHPDTRKAVLDHIRSWASNSDSQPVMWIRGGAGAGKSAIAQTLSENWDKDGMLAASFYFSRTAAGRNEKKYLISTLAYQISSSIPSSRPLIEGVLRRTPRIFERNLRTQLQQLIINPLVTLSESVSINTKLVVIDGLDECCVNYSNQDFEQQQKEILECIQWAVNYDGFPLRFFIASRPERQIREIFEYGSLKSVTHRIVLDDSQNPSADIELFLRCRLDEIKQRHPHLGPEWPSDDIITQLVQKSSGHFIYIAVVMRYLSTPRMDPNAGLNAIMSISPGADKTNPFTELDALYTHILQSIATEALPTVTDVFRLMIYGHIGAQQWDLFDFSISRHSPTFISKYLFISPGQLYLHLIDLHSLLDIPAQETDRSARISFLHASFSEYLTQSARSKQFYIDQAQASLRVLSLSVRHVYVQVLSPEGGKGDEYVASPSHSGFAWQTSQALSTIEPDDNILEGLRALIDQDDTAFASYVHRADLSSLRTTRRSLEIIDDLYTGSRSIVTHAAEKNEAGDLLDLCRPTILEILKRHSIQDFVPFDPAEAAAKERSINYSYAGALDWFCKTQDAVVGTPDYSKLEILDPTSSALPPKEPKVTHDIPDALPTPSSFDAAVEQSTSAQDTSDPDSAQPHSPEGLMINISTQEQLQPDPVPLPPVESADGTSYQAEELGDADPREQQLAMAHPPSPKARPDSLPVVDAAAGQRWEPPTRKETPQNFLRQFVGLGLRVGSPGSLNPSWKGGVLRP